MASRREKSPNKRMRKIALVICEGETEVGYLNLIKKWYKSPVRIVSHIEGTRITQALVDKHTYIQTILRLNIISAIISFLSTKNI